MIPEEFRKTVLPRVVAAWDDRCFCASPGFQKLLSFDFRDYGVVPTGLADSEILIDAIIRERFTRRGEPQSHQGESRQAYVCPQCQATCTELYAEFSISMYQSTVIFHNDPKAAAEGLYLVGFYGFKEDAFGKITDYRRASTVEAFMQELTGRHG